MKEHINERTQLKLCRKLGNLLNIYRGGVGFGSPDVYQRHQLQNDVKFKNALRVHVEKLKLSAFAASIVALAPKTILFMVVG